MRSFARDHLRRSGCPEVKPTPEVERALSSRSPPCSVYLRGWHSSRQRKAANRAASGCHVRRSWSAHARRPRARRRRRGRALQPSGGLGPPTATPRRPGFRVPLDTPDGRREPGRLQPPVRGPRQLDRSRWHLDDGVVVPLHPQRFGTHHRRPAGRPRRRSTPPSGRPPSCRPGPADSDGTRPSAAPRPALVAPARHGCRRRDRRRGRSLISCREVGRATLRSPPLRRACLATSPSQRRTSRPRQGPVRASSYRPGPLPVGRVRAPSGSVWATSSRPSPRCSAGTCCAPWSSSTSRAAAKRPR